MSWFKLPRQSLQHFHEEAVCSGVKNVDSPVGPQNLVDKSKGVSVSKLNCRFRHFALCVVVRTHKGDLPTRMNRNLRTLSLSSASA
jgi:hypothetical protein